MAAPIIILTGKAIIPTGVRGTGQVGIVATVGTDGITGEIIAGGVRVMIGGIVGVIDEEIGGIGEMTDEAIGAIGETIDAAIVVINEMAEADVSLIEEINETEHEMV
jgi:hypothetical protein